MVVRRTSHFQACALTTPFAPLCQRLLTTAIVARVARLRQGVCVCGGGGDRL